VRLLMLYDRLMTDTRQGETIFRVAFNPPAGCWADATQNELKGGWGSLFALIQAPATFTKFADLQVRAKATSCR
jgi:hypothetical protein